MVFFLFCWYAASSDPPVRYNLNPALQKMKKITFFISRHYVKNKKASSFTDEVK